MRIALLFTLLALTLHAAQIHWYSDYNEAVTAAKKSHKPLMLYLSQPGCRTCIFMKEQVFTDATVKSYVDGHFIAAELNIRDAALPEKYHVRVSPVFTFLDTEHDEIVEQIMGGRKAPKFLNTLQSVIEDNEGFR